MTVEPAGFFPYASAAAFRSALRDRLAALAKQQGTHGLDELQRQFAYDRLLARVFDGPDADRWILKGAGALLARLPDARHSRDLDLAYSARHQNTEPRQGLRRRPRGIRRRSSGRADRRSRP
jgi:Nucleotidyl transferase AbiEii toxin, Type IV TA system